MASKTLFQSLVGKLLPKADPVNEAGGSAYSFSRKHALAQYASTGCLNSTFYASDDEQLARVRSSFDCSTQRIVDQLKPTQVVVV